MDSFVVYRWLCKLCLLVFLCQVRASSNWYYMDDDCGQRVTLTADKPDGKLFTTLGFKYDDNVYNCTLVVEAPSNQKILWLFASFDVDTKSQGSCTDYLEMWDGDMDSGTQLTPDGGLCGTIADTPSTGYATSGNKTTLLWHTDSLGNDYGFQLNFNTFTDAPCDPVTQFSCKNGRCIAKKLENDLRDNCGDSSDEYEIVNFFGKILALGLGALIGIIVGVVVIFILCVVGCICCCVKCCCKKG
ncbi:neuropilin-1-like [Ptychodera flava]|uniref:neuropilin-1-like n=1 Tax=Ptychodera flava TaxID=63121 RepID=UPI00396A4B6B